MKSLRITLAVLLLAVAFRVSAIVVNSFPYEIKFNRAQDAVGWQFAGTDSAKTRHWVIGSLPGYDYIGDTCLYVMENGSYGISQNVSGRCAVTAYCPLTQIPAGEYKISFRYRSTSHLNNQYFSYQLQDTVPTWELTHDWKQLHVGLTNDDLWQEAHATFTSTGATKYLVFRIWVGGSATDRTVYAAPAIDDILITEVVADSVCLSAPTNLSYTRSGNNAVFAWDGNATSYQLQYFMNDTPRAAFYDIPSLAATSYTVDCTTIPEGPYTIRVRSVCGADRGEWTTMDYKLIYDNTRHGLDYLSFTDSTNVEGHTGYSYRTQWTRHIVDSGYTSVGSRQTIHYIPHDTDPRTNYKLRTFPQGQPASIRLGNWNPYGEAEDLVYKMHVDSDEQIMKLQYALVMQLPGHDTVHGPRFQLQILNMNDQLIDSCSMVNFTDSINLRSGWDTVHVAGQRDIVWKDWSLMSFHIGQYVGQNIKLRMINEDCPDGEHFGYGYFTLERDIARIEGTRCGNDPATFVAEDGFKYRWYRKYQTPRVYRGYGQSFTVQPTDTNTYCVDLINLIDTTCYFTMEASSYAYEPYAAATYQMGEENCRYYVQFTDESTVDKSYYDGSGKHIVGTESPERYYWDFGKYGVKTEANPKFVFPAEGDTFCVTLHIFKGECEDSATICISAPAITPKQGEPQTHTICHGESVTVGGKVYTEAGHYLDTVKTAEGCDSTLDITIIVKYPQSVTLDTFKICEGAYVTVGGTNYYNEGKNSAYLKTSEGCDSIVTFTISFIEPELRYYVDTLCPSQLPYTWYDQTINESGEHTLTYNEKGVVNDCDTIIHINNVFVYPQVKVTLEQEAAEFCEGENGTIEIQATVTDGKIVSYDLTFDQTLLSQGFHDQIGVEMPADNRLTLDFSGTVQPGRYYATLTLYNYVCDPVTMPVELVIMYTPDSIITQRWNDFLAVRKTAYNQWGGFYNYQWYRDGQALAGETNSELYLPKEGLSMSSVYQVELTRTRDNIRVKTCYYHPTQEPNSSTMTVAPSQIRSDAPQAVSIESEQSGVCQLFNSSGVLIMQWSIEAGRSEFDMPTTPGLYILRVALEDGTVETQKIIVE